MADITIPGRRLHVQEGSSRTDECFPVYLERREKRFFGEERNHTTDLPLRKNQLRVYCRGLERDGRTYVEVVKAYQYDIGITDAPCTDFMEEIDFKDGGMPSTVVRDMNGVLLAIYIHKLNTLCCCDLTHTRDGMYGLMKLLDRLHADGVIHEYAGEEEEEEENEIQISLGCDPEYEGLFNGVISRARDMSWNQNSHVGIDGAGDQIEFRPSPSSSPDGFVDSLRSCYKFVADQSINLSTVGNKYPLGAHIHIGVGMPDVSIGDPNITKLFDLFLGKHLMRLSGEARREYKQLGQLRKKPHGFEYRSLPTAVLHTPEIAKAVANISQVIAKRYYSGYETVSSDRGATIKQMVEIGIPEEDARLVKNWKDMYREVCTQSPLTFWLGEDYGTVEEAFIPSIQFGDDWHSGARDIFIDLLPQREQLRGSVLFFGLSVERGDVTFGYEAPGYTATSESFSHMSGRADFVFGIPKKIRDGQITTRELEEHLKNIISMIKKEQ